MVGILILVSRKLTKAFNANVKLKSKEKGAHVY